MSAATFWDKQATAATARRVAARFPQDAPAVCEDCHVEKEDVLYGCCAECFFAWKAAQ